VEKKVKKKNDSIIRIDDGYTQTQETIKPTQKEFGSNNNTTSLGNFNEQVLIKKEISGAIIIGSFRAKVNAEKIKQTLLNEGFVNVGISKVGSVNRVSILVSGSKEEAQEVLKKVKVNHKSAWINYN
jgi:cell division protein FtsN